MRFYNELALLLTRYAERGIKVSTLRQSPRMLDVMKSNPFINLRLSHLYEISEEDNAPSFNKK